MESRRERGRYSPDQPETPCEALIREIRQGARWTIDEADRDPGMVKVMCRMICEDCNVLLNRMQRDYEYAAFFGVPCILGGSLELSREADEYVLFSSGLPVISIFD
jgi:hypothetical protein